MAFSNGRVLIFILFSLSTISLCIKLGNDFKPIQGLEIVQAKDYIQKLKEIKAGSSYYKSVVHDLLTLVDTYYFKEIAKKPLIPDKFPSDYFNKVDLVTEINNVKTDDNTNIYDFYRGLRKIVMSLKDNHFRLDLYNYASFDFQNSYVVIPVNFETVLNENEEPEMRLSNNTLAAALNAYSFFNNSEEVVSMINKNLNTKVKTINGKSPFEFIYEFQSEFNPLKGYHGRYSYMRYLIEQFNLRVIPIDVDSLNFEVVYENGDSFSTQFLIAYLSNSENKNDLSFEEINKRPFDYDMLKLRQQKEKLSSEKLKKKIEWNYNYDYIMPDGSNLTTFQCYEDKENHMNVYHQISFSINLTPEGILKFQQTLLNCALLFDKNNFPIIVIEDLNSGGNLTPVQLFQEFLQPRMISTRLYGSFPATDFIKKSVETKVGDFSVYEFLIDLKTGKKYTSAEEMFKDNITDKIGDGITFKRTRPASFTLEGPNRYGFDRIRELIKNYRKPTDIIIFTDGYSYSATSLFIKGIQRFGGAIIAGYNGHPTNYYDYFDAAQSPSGFLQYDTVAEEKKRLLQKGFDLSIITNFATYDDDYRPESKEIPMPSEYKVDLIDERTKIFNRFSEDNYEQFISEAKRIFKFYETNCNYNNQRLTLDSRDCDKKFEFNMTHGGYKCGSNSLWDMSTCKAYYCDLGYYFDTYLDMCVVDPYSNHTRPKPVPSGSFNIKIEIYGLLLIGVLLL